MNSMMIRLIRVIPRVLFQFVLFLFFLLGLFAVPSISRAADPASGVATSTIIDLGSAVYFETITWDDTTPAGTSVTMEVRAGNQSDLSDGVWTTTTKGYSLDTNFDGRRYVQYRVTLATDDGDSVPSLNEVSIGYVEPGTFSLISSPFNTGDAVNVVASIAWNATTPEGTGVKFHVRTSADNSTWTSWMGPDGTNGTYFTDNTGAQDMPAALGDGENDRWIQYQAFLSTDSASVPILSDVTFTYVVNAPPEIVITTETVAQDSDGNVTIDYNVRDIDSESGGTPGVVAVSLQYCTANCSSAGSETWATAGAPSLSGDHGSSIAVNTVATTTYTSYSLTWTPTSSHNNQYNGSDFKVRLVADDSEAANNTGTDESNTFILDTTDPVVNSFSIDTRSNATSSLNISVTDDTSAGLLMKLSNNSSLASDGVNAGSGTWVAYTSTSTWTFNSGTTTTLYYQIKDAYGNISAAGAISSVVAPQTPAHIVFRDISNADTAEWREFIAWGMVSAPSPGFKRYTIYRSTDGSTYETLATETDRTVNYYIDTGLDTETTYYYKVTAEDNDNNISRYSSVVSDIPNGQGGSDVTAPTISSVATSSVGTQSATITWNTDELSSSYVDYMTSTGGDFSAATSEGVTTMLDTASGLGVHRVVLSGLTPDTTYYFRVRSLDPDSNEGTSTLDPDGYSFTTLSGPTITNVAASDITNTSVTVTWTTDEATDSYVYYSTDSALGSPTLAGTDDSVTSHSVTISGLTQGTRYYYYVKSGITEDKNVIDGVTTYYTVSTITDLTAPIISSVTAGVVTDDQALITWDTDEGATSRVWYGTGTGVYGSSSTLNSAYDVSHSVILSGLLAETAYYYIVVSGDSSGNSATSSEYTFTTLETLTEESEVVIREEAARAEGAASAPRSGGGGGSSIDRTPPVVSNVLVSNITSDSATIKWSTNENANTLVEFGKTTEYGRGSLDLENTQIHSIDLVELMPETVYFYRVSSIDTSGNRSVGVTGTFNTISLLEEMASSTESIIEESDEELSDAAEKLFLSTIEKAGQIIQSLAGRVSVGVLESSLLAQAQIIEQLSSILPLPIIGGQPLVDAGSNYAIVSWSTDKNANSLVEFASEGEFLSNRTYSQTVGEPTASRTGHVVEVKGLLPDTVYHYRVVSRTQTGSETKSQDFVFKTRPQTNEITNHNVVVLSPEEASFSWNTTVPTDSAVVYTPYRNGVPQIEARQVVRQAGLTIQHSLKVAGFEAGVLYDVELLGTDTGNNVSSRVIRGFTTEGEDLAPVISQIQTDAAIVPGGKEKIQIIISWVTNELSTSRLFYRKGFAAEGTTFAASTTLDQNYTKKHVVVVTNFEPGTVYQFVVESIDSSGNVGISKTITILTPQKEQSVFQVIFSNVEDMFSWVGRLRR